MKELFDNDGHLTDIAFMLLDSNKLDDLQRLEIAEHNSFCDECLDRYIGYVEKSELMIPSEVMKKKIENKILVSNRKLYLNQYISVAIAACFTMLFWVTGAFNISYNNCNLVNLTSNFTQKTIEITEGISDKFNQIFYNIKLEGDNLYEEK